LKKFVPSYVNALAVLVLPGAFVDPPANKAAVCVPTAVILLVEVG
jgi:hypothetical protein